MCKKVGVKLENERLYKHVPNLVDKIHEGRLIILQNQGWQTDRTIPNYESDIITCDMEKGTYLFTYVAN